MIPLPRGIDEPDGPWPGRIMLGLFGLCLLVPVLGAEIGLGALVRRGQGIPPEVVEAARSSPDLAASGLVLLHFLLVFGAMKLCAAGIASRLLHGGEVRLRGRRLAGLFSHHRKHLVSYFSDGETPKYVVEVDPVGGGVPHRTLNLLLGILIGAALLEVVVIFSAGIRDLELTTYPRWACTGVLTLALVTLLFGDLDRLRARAVGGIGAVTLVVLCGLDPSLLSWGPGMVPAMALLLMGLVVRATREDASTEVLFLTNKGVRLIELSGEGIEDVRGATLKPSRLILSPGTGESAWELFSEGNPPLKVQPLGGHAQEIGVTGALHGFPVRITGEGGPGGLMDELAGQARSLLPTLCLAALLFTMHWLPMISAIVGRSG